MDLSFSAGRSRKQSISVWQCEVPQSGEEGAGFSVKPLNRWRTQGGIKGWGGRGGLAASLYFLPVLWLVLTEGVEPFQGLPLPPNFSAQFAECWGCCCVQHIPAPSLLSPESLCPAAFPLYPAVLPLQVWIFSHQLLAGWRKRGVGCWMLGWRQKHVRYGTALSQRDKNITNQNVSVGRYLCQYY